MPRPEFWLSDWYSPSDPFCWAQAWNFAVRFHFKQNQYQIPTKTVISPTSCHPIILQPLLKTHICLCNLRSQLSLWFTPCMGWVLFCTSLVRSGTFTGRCSILLDPFLSRLASVEKCPCSNGCCRFRTLFPNFFFFFWELQNVILKNYRWNSFLGILNEEIHPGGSFGVVGHPSYTSPWALLGFPKVLPKPEHSQGHPPLSGDDGGIFGWFSF